MTNFLLDFKLYMGHLARLHRELQDTPDERHYFFGDLPDFWANLRSEVNFPAMVAEYSEVNYEGGKSNVSKRRVTSFSIVDSYDQAGDVNEMVVKVSNCEKIAEEVLGRMIKDPDSEKPFRTIDIESITGEYNACADSVLFSFETVPVVVTGFADRVVFVVVEALIVPPDVFTYAGAAGRNDCDKFPLIDSFALCCRFAYEYTTLNL